jgi:serine/threonine protein kinase
MYFNFAKSGLNNVVILDPQWLANVMSSLISFKHMWVKAGILSPEAFPQVWKEYPPHLYDTLLGILTKFDVAVQLGSGDNIRYMIPSLLPIEPPETLPQIWPILPEKTQHQFGRVYQLSFEFDFGRLVARVLCLPDIEVELYWRNGVVLKSTQSHERALVEWKQQTSRATIAVRVDHKHYQPHNLIFLRLFVDMIESILESFYPGSDSPQRLVPCTHCLEQGNLLLGPFHFTYEACVAAVTNGESLVFCRGVPSRAVSISHLAPDIALDDFPMIEDDELEILEQICVGGFGRVFRGRFQKKYDVAIKELKLNETEQNEIDKFQEFQREVYIMSALYHTNLVQFYGITVSPHLRMVMEWCPGGDLYHFLQSNEGISWDLRLRICLDIAKGMDYLQGITPPVIHRDLRSPNVFMMSKDPCSEVVAKVADFGLSLRVEHRVGGILPTWRWLAPEVINVNNLYYDQTADIYSFAIVMWEIVTRDAPFFEYSDMREIQIKQAIIHENLRPTIPEECPLELAELIRRCWDADPAQRPPFSSSIQVLSTLIRASNGSVSNTSQRDSNPRNAVRGSIASPRGPKGHVKPNESVFAVLDAKLEFVPYRDSAIYCMTLVGNLVWTGHDDGYITVWDVEVGFFLLLSTYWI